MKVKRQLESQALVIKCKDISASLSYCLGNASCQNKAELYSGDSLQTRFVQVKVAPLYERTSRWRLLGNEYLVYMWVENEFKADSLISEVSLDSWSVFVLLPVVLFPRHHETRIGRCLSSIIYFLLLDYYNHNHMDVSNRCCVFCDWHW